MALMIVAVAISSLLFQMMSTINNTAYLREQTVAHWVALNQLELIYLENRQSNQLITRERSGTEEMAGKEWFWMIKPVKTDNDNFIQLVVSVYADENDQESSIVSVTGLIDRFHKKL